jgi:NDP-sugar pyrophosphorylase family protein
MKAMVFAAGLGTRLRPLTNDRPKALVTIGGRTLLEITLARLRSFGAGEAIVNVHHFADQVVEYLAANRNFGMRIEVSREEILLDTGGGLKKAAWFFLERDAGPHGEIDEPFLVHNVDVLSSIDLARMVEFHRQHNALATLAVQERATSRPLVFDAGGQLNGRGTSSTVSRESVHNTESIAPPTLAAKTKTPRGWGTLVGSPAQGLQSLAFSGIHAVSPRIFAKLDEEGVFPIVDAYVRLANQGESILGFRADDAYWRDLGLPENLTEAERDLTDGTYPAA